MSASAIYIYIFVDPSSIMWVHRSRKGNVAVDVFSELLHVVFMKYGECVINLYRSHDDGGCGAVEMANLSNCSMLQVATRGDMGDPHS